MQKLFRIFLRCGTHRVEMTVEFTAFNFRDRFNSFQLGVTEQMLVQPRAFHSPCIRSTTKQLCITNRDFLIADASSKEGFKWKNDIFIAVSCIHEIPPVTVSLQ